MDKTLTVDELIFAFEALPELQDATATPAMDSIFFCVVQHDLRKVR